MVSATRRWGLNNVLVLYIRTRVWCKYPRLSRIFTEKVGVKELSIVLSSPPTNTKRMRLLILFIFLLGSSIQLTHVRAYKQEVKFDERQQGRKSQRLKRHRALGKSAPTPARIPSKASSGNNNNTVKATQPFQPKAAPVSKPLTPAKNQPNPALSNPVNDKPTTSFFQPKAAPAKKPGVTPFKPVISSIQQPWQPILAWTDVNISGMKNPVPAPTRTHPSNRSNPLTPAQKQPNPGLSTPVNSKPTTSFFQPKAAPAKKPGVTPFKPVISSIQQPWQPILAPTDVKVSGTKNPVPAPTSTQAPTDVKVSGTKNPVPAPTSTHPSNPSNPITPAQKQPSPVLSTPVNSKPTTSSPSHGNIYTPYDWYCGNRTAKTCSSQTCTDPLNGCSENENNYRDCLHECIPVLTTKPMKAYSKPVTLKPITSAPVTLKPITSSPVSTKPTPFGGIHTQFDWYCGNRETKTCSSQKCTDPIAGCSENKYYQDCLSECIPVPSAKPLKSSSKPATLAPFNSSPF